MAIYQYEENGKTFWKVYVHVRSSSYRSRRIQKYSYEHKTEAEARREEKKLTIQGTKEMERLDVMGLDWKDVLHLWKVDFEQGRIGNVSERSAKDYLGSITKWTNPWMDRVAATLDLADGRELINRMEKAGLSRAYQKKVKNMINSVFTWGVEFRHIKNNPLPPLKGLLVKKGEEKAPDILSLEEIKKFLSVAQALNHRWYPIWAFAVLTGMRSGELHALAWDQVDLEKDYILVDRSYDANLKKIGQTKGRYWRTVPINSSLRSLIMDLKNGPSNDSDGVHVLPRIKDWDNGDQAVSLRNFLKSISVKPIKFHALRACFATQMLASGVTAPVVMRIGGWKKSSTMDIYLRLAGVDTKGATDCLQFIPDKINFGDNVVNLFENQDGLS